MRRVTTIHNIESAITTIINVNKLLLNIKIIETLSIN